MTEIKPGDRVAVTAVVESAGHDDQHVIVRVGGRPVQVPIPADAESPALRDAIQKERATRYRQAHDIVVGGGDQRMLERNWGWTDALDWVLALLDPEAERLAPEHRKDA